MGKKKVVQAEKKKYQEELKTEKKGRDKLPYFKGVFLKKKKDVSSSIEKKGAHIRTEESGRQKAYAGDQTTPGGGSRITLVMVLKAGGGSFRRKHLTGRQPEPKGEASIRPAIYPTLSKQRRASKG